MKVKRLSLLSIACLLAGTTFAQQSAWRTSEDGWVMRKAPDSKKYEKFFAIGLWNIPGYTTSSMESDPKLYRKVSKPYLDQSANYNTVYTAPGDLEYARKRVEVTGSIGFYEALKTYQEGLSGLPQGADRDYAVRQHIKKNVNNNEFVTMLDNAIDNIITQNGKNDHIWAPIDEIVNGGAGSGWCWHPVVGEKIKERINQREPNTLVYTDLVGISRGNSFLFERRYLQSHSEMPATPPYEALGPQAAVMVKRPLLGFVQTFDGRPVYDNGTANYTEYDVETLKTLFMENLKICAEAYKGCGDVFGINSFIDCNTYPVLAGVVVDGIKAGIGKEVPVWIFFDGNGYAKPSNISADVFAQNLKCQMYTSIIHGATGVLFWNDRSNSPEVFNALEPIVEELTNNLPLIYLPTETAEFNNDLHYMIKIGKKGKKYIIASNTSNTQTLELNLPNGFRQTLKPHEVIITPLR